MAAAISCRSVNQHEILAGGKIETVNARGSTYDSLTHGHRLQYLNVGTGRRDQGRNH